MQTCSRNDREAKPHEIATTTSLEETFNPPVVVDANRIGRWYARQTWHRHDCPGYDDHEFSACRETNFPDRHDMP